MSPHFNKLNTLALNLILKIKEINHKRIYTKRVKDFANSEDIVRSYRAPPRSIKSILFLEAQGGWGDSFYFASIFRELANRQYNIDIAAINSFRYKTLPYICNLFELENKETADYISELNYDIAVDLTYVTGKEWELRKSILKNLKCFTCTISNFYQHSKLFDKFIDISTEAHWKNRCAIILNYIIKSEDKKIKSLSPTCPTCINPIKSDHFLASLPDNFNYVYVNTVGGSSNRMLSKEQIIALIKGRTINSSAPD